MSHEIQTPERLGLPRTDRNSGLIQAIAYRESVVVYYDSGDVLDVCNTYGYYNRRDICVVDLSTVSTPEALMQITRIREIGGTYEPTSWQKREAYLVVRFFDGFLEDVGRNPQRHGSLNRFMQILQIARETGSGVMLTFGGREDWKKIDKLAKKVHFLKKFLEEFPFNRSIYKD